MAWNEPGGGNNSNNQDPWGSGGNRGGNRGGKQGPPDLDDALKKLQDSLNGMFGNKKRGGDDDGGNRNVGGGQGIPKGIWGIGLLILFAFWLFNAIYMVDEQEQAIVLRFGEYHRTEESGLHIYFPPIERKFQRNVTLIRSYSQTGMMLTEDENIVQVPLTVQYRIANLEDFALKVEDPETSLRHATESALRHVAGSMTLQQVLTEGRERLGAEVNERLQNYLDMYQTGITVVSVNVTDAQPPSEVQDAFLDVIRAREDEERERNQAQSYANRVIPEARGRAQRQLEEANGYRDEVIARALGETSRFDQLLTQYQAAPEIMRERLFIQTMQEVLQNTSKVMITNSEGNNNLMYLPLDRLMQQSSSGSSGSSSSSSATGGSLTDGSARLPMQLPQRDARSRESR
ncbi:MAG: FtsH protease activity modulator HflK [Pseudomonadaceae bacterium]|nr:MAG: FtsH protease activity modulator HflK [Pseudomonadaceae bacterium]